jgi:hypothetical protein
MTSANSSKNAVLPFGNLRSNPLNYGSITPSLAAVCYSNRPGSTCTRRPFLAGTVGLDFTHQKFIGPDHLRSQVLRTEGSKKINFCRLRPNVLVEVLSPREFWRSARGSSRACRSNCVRAIANLFEIVYRRCNGCEATARLSNPKSHIEHQTSTFRIRKTTSSEPAQWAAWPRLVAQHSSRMDKS